jgi:hypothetical protein
MAKLNEIRGEAAVDVLADLIAPTINIATDPELARGIVEVGRDAEAGKERREAIIGYLKENIPALIKSHRADVIAILAALHGEDAKEYAANLTPIALMRDLVETLNDEAFVGFFTSAAQENVASASTLTTTESPLALA